MNAVHPGLVGIPCRDFIWSAAVQSQFELVSSAPPGSAFVYEPTISSIASKRNWLVEVMLADPSHGWLFFVDSDMEVPPGALQRLLSHGKDIVSGLYYRRAAPYEPLAAHATAAGTVRPIGEVGGPEPLREVDCVGAGALLVRRHVFERMAPPWFVPVERVANRWSVDEGEDFAFCRAASAAGFKIHVDTSLCFGHLGVTSIDTPFALGAAYARGVQ